MLLPVNTNSPAPFIGATTTTTTTISSVVSSALAAGQPISVASRSMNEPLAGAPLMLSCQTIELRASSSTVTGQVSGNLTMSIDASGAARKLPTKFTVRSSSPYLMLSKTACSLDATTDHNSET
jgi:hypothetical protein